MANAPTPDDIGRVYRLHGRRVVLLNDRGVAVASADRNVTVKAVDPRDGEYPTVAVDFSKLTETDERISAPEDVESGDTWADSDGDDEADMLDMPVTNVTEARAFIQRVQGGAPLADAAAMSVVELREWVEATKQKAPAGSGLPRGAARLETVRLLREMCYSASELQWDSESKAVAQVILDTPVDELAAMVVMSDTVMGNWRTIAATLVPA